MHELLMLIIGAIFGAILNLGTKWLDGRVSRRAAITAAARRVYWALMHHGAIESNDLDRAGSVASVEAAWGKSREALVGAGVDRWLVIEEGVIWTIAPDLLNPPPPDSHNSRLERALVVLEPIARLPHDLRCFTNT